MTLEEVNVFLAGFGLPFAYNHFARGVPSVPYIIVMELDYQMNFADDLSWSYETAFGIELYTSRKDPSIERQMERAFADALIPFEKVSSVWLKSEKVYQTVYYI